MVNTLGEKIRKLRKKKGYTLDKLAELTSSSKSYIWELENKNPPRPSAEKLSKIAGKLAVTIEYLLDNQNIINEDKAEDAQFYRNYKKMSAETKKKIRQMVIMWGDDEE